MRKYPSRSSLIFKERPYFCHILLLSIDRQATCLLPHFQVLMAASLESTVVSQVCLSSSGWICPQLEWHKYEQQMQKLLAKQWEKEAVLMQRKHPFGGDVIGENFVRMWKGALWLLSRLDVMTCMYAVYFQTEAHPNPLSWDGKREQETTSSFILK